MLIDARELPSDALLQCDICIVGAGPAGITLAKEMEGKGLDVLVLEAGGEGIDEATDDLLLGEVTDPRYPIESEPYPLRTTRAKGIGGSSLRWCLPEGWRARALDPIDFEQREGIPYSGWPITFEEIRPYYERARQFCRLDSEHDDPAYWANDGDENNLLIHEGGVKSKFFFRADTHLYSRRKNEFARSESLTLVTFANVVELETGPEARRVVSAKAKTLAGNELRVEAKTFVLAAGGIDNARILLGSNRVAKHGLGNDRDLVGRFFMEHPHLFTGLLELRNRADADRMRFYISVRQRSGTLVEGMLALDERVLRRHALPNAGFWVWGVGVKGALEQLFVDSRQLFKPGAASRSRRLRLHNLAGDLASVLDIPLQRAVHRHGHNNLFRVYVESEQVPNPESRVMLSQRRDPLGMHRVKLDWRLKAEDFDTIRRSQEVLSEELQRLGIARLHRLLGDETPMTKLGIGNHQIGTTRMSDNPNHGVVDRHGRIHGIDNLYVTGASVFPTGGAANPTLTVIALAIRMADTLVQRRAERHA
jgi:choline dehydrogenase-like flavoprotein